jgi:CheY-like chemotaxis protein
MKKVLVIDDDLIVAVIYRRFLTAHGFAVEVARDGAAGLDMLVASRPDAVILDLMMPKISGLNVLRTIRAQPAFANLPVLIMTAAAFPALVEEAREAGANWIFDKSNDKPLAVVGVLHDLLRTTSDSHLVGITKSGNPESVLDHWPERADGWDHHLGSEAASQPFSFTAR